MSNDFDENIPSTSSEAFAKNSNNVNVDQVLESEEADGSEEYWTPSEVRIVNLNIWAKVHLSMGVILGILVFHILARGVEILDILSIRISYLLSMSLFTLNF